MELKSSFFFSLVVGLTPTIGLSAAPKPPGHAVRPNVLFIVVDDLRPELGAYGSGLAVTPNIDRLAAQGVTFLRAYCQEAVCTPSRASAMTGRRPDYTEVWNLYTRLRGRHPDIVTLPEYFKNHGYATTAFGKIYHSQEAYQDPRSWSEPATLYANDIAQGYFLPENKDAGPNEGRPVTGRKMASTEGAEVPDERYPDGIIARRAAEWIGRHAREHRAEPFFLAVGFHKPHLPFSAPKRYWDFYDRAQLADVANPRPPADQLALALPLSLPELRGYGDIPKTGFVGADKSAELRHGYMACVSFIDAQVGLLLDQLERSGEVAHTIVVLWGDHGYHLGERGYWCKATNYELDARVPVIIKVPGLATAGRQSNALVELVDLYPTLVDLASLPGQPSSAGMSLRALLEKPDAEFKSEAYTQFPRPWESGDWRKAPRIMGYSVRTDRWRFVSWVDLETGGEIARELYDHSTDGPEMNNLADVPKFREIQRYHAQLLAAARPLSVPPAHTP